MAWPTRSKVLGIKKQVGVVANTLYLIGGPAAGHTWLIKNISIFNGSTAQRTFYFYLSRAGVDYAVGQQIVPTFGVSRDPSTTVLEAGDALKVQVTATFAERIEIGVFGALLG